MNREGLEVARCTVERLMKRLRLAGGRRGKVVRSTIPDKAIPCPLDRVNCQFRADRPKQLWVSDFTYVTTWQGWLYLAFVIDVFARRIVGWRVSRLMRTDFVLNALEQALYARQPELSDALIHDSDRGSQPEFKQLLHEDYRRLLIPVDFSPLSVQAICFARKLAPAADILLLYAFEAPFEGKLALTGDKDSVMQCYRGAARENAMHRMRHLAQKAGLEIGDYT